ncbi:MAG: serine/threonine-protein kinase [Candidatus Eremiobacteraeota bacterium]|nr:serine/threonine-protein kinase [Candidatus Eremiobacteraeota bacterium]
MSASKNRRDDKIHMERDNDADSMDIIPDPDTVFSEQAQEAARKDSLASSGSSSPSIPGYELSHPIGAGSFGEVWSAVQKSTGQKVAVKILRRRSFSDISYMEREVSRLASVTEHPTIVTLIDADLTFDTPYLVTPLLPGSLAGYRNVPMEDRGQVVKWCEQIAKALQYVHGKGILHCDLKPGNILIDEAGNARIVDFGQARLMGEGEASLGTLWFMAPEQVRIADEAVSRQLPDVSWDIYALGATMYCLLTGFPPRVTEELRKELAAESDANQRLRKYREIISETPLKPIRRINPSVDADLAAIIEHCLEVDPSGRYDTINSLLQDLQNRRTKMPLRCVPKSMLYSARRFMMRNLAVLVLILVALISSFHTCVQIIEKNKMIRRYDLKVKTTRERLARMEFEHGLALAGDPESCLWMARAYVDSPSAFYRNAIFTQLERFPGLYRIFPGSGRITADSISPDGRKIVLITEDRAASIWDIKTGVRQQASLAHEDRLTSASFSPDGGRAATTSLDRTLRIWDTEKAAGLTISMLHESAVLFASFSPDGRKIASCTVDNTLRIWNAETGRAITPPLSHRNKITSFMFSPDGDEIMTTSESCAAQLWDAESGELSSQFTHGRGAVNAAAFSPDGKRILTGGSDATARIWNVNTGAEMTPPIRCGGAVSSASFSPDGMRIVTATNGGAVQLWNAENGKPFTPPMQHSMKVTCACFTPDGKEIMTACADNTVRLWHIETEKEPQPGAQNRQISDPASAIGEGYVWQLKNDDDAPPELIELAVQLWRGAFLDAGGALHPMDFNDYLKRKARFNKELSSHEKKCKYKHYE